MKINKLSKITAIILMSSLTLSQINAADVTITDGSPRLIFNDTNTPASEEWSIQGVNNSNFYMTDHNAGETFFRVDSATSNSNALAFWAKNNGEVCLAWDTVCIAKSANDLNSLVVDSSGDINLANGSVFIDRSSNYVGIGTVAPTEDLHIIDNSPTIYLQDSTLTTWALNENGGSTVFDIAYSKDTSTLSFVRPFRIEENAADDSLVIDSTSNIGIGTNNPVEAVDVYRNNAASRFQLTSVSDDSVNVAQFVQRRARAGATAIVRNDNMGQFSFRGHNGTAYSGTRAGIAVLAAEDWSSGNEGTRMIFTVTPNGSNTPQHGLRIENNGDVYVPNGNLYVGSTRLHVPDYVFQKEYNLMPLGELKTFISKNNHLPGITAASKVTKEGYVDMTQMQMNLLEKVEELTLYTLQQEKALASKDTEMKKMQEKISKLESMQKRLAKVESLLTNLALDTSNSKTEKVSLNNK